MTYICLDLRAMDIKEVHEKFKIMLDFPRYYAANYSALYDELTSVNEDFEVNILIDEEDLDKWQTLRRVLSDAAKSNKHIFLRGRIFTIEED